MKKTKKNLKTVVFSLGLGMAMLTTISVQAQMINLLDEYYDELGQQDNDNAPMLQRGGVSGEGLTVLTQDFGQETPAPLGSGIAILIGAGLGYVALKKEGGQAMKRLAILLGAFVLAIGLTQCKKGNNTNNTSVNDENMVHLTVNVNNIRAQVNPNNGKITFNNGDKLLVGYDHNCVGYLEYSNGSFSGNLSLTEATESQKLHFYFLGGKAEHSVDIKDQTGNTMPVISCGTSTTDYSSNTTSYTTTLFNKCALVKFNLACITHGGTIALSGFKTVVTVDFAQNTLTYGYSDGLLEFGAGTMDKWAILLPQGALDAGDEGSAWIWNSDYVGTRGAVPAITENGYLPEGIKVKIPSYVSNIGGHGCVDLGLPSGLLWATENVGLGGYYTWGDINTSGTPYYWGNYVFNYGYQNTTCELTKYCNNSIYGHDGFTDNLTTLLPEDDAATVSWGAGWRMPTKGEWQELINNTTQTSVFDGLHGIDGIDFTASNGRSLHLSRVYGYDGGLDVAGYYWSSSLDTDNPRRAWYFKVGASARLDNIDRFHGMTIRPVHAFE